MNNFGNSIRELYRERKGKTMRVSSYDRTGGNVDCDLIKPSEVKVIFDIKTTGCITHIWSTMCTITLATDACLERKVIIRMFWDNEDTPSVEAPIGDFFGMGHGISKNFVSAPLSMCPQDGKGYNCYFPLPFERAARIEIVNESTEIMLFYYYVDYEEYEEPINSDLRFHARWARETTQGIDQSKISNELFTSGGYNLTGDNNYVIMTAEGRGHYVGCNMNIHNLNYTSNQNWYGEGDDMIFIDGEPWPPRLHGTGMEDYFNTAFSPQEEYNAPYSGIILAGKPNFWGKSTYYRYHIQDPIIFNKSIKVTIEHGHNNNRSDDYSSTAYWYQSEPHMKYDPILPVDQRLPLPDVEDFNMEELIKIKMQRDVKAKEMGLDVVELF